MYDSSRNTILCNFGITGIGPILPLYIKHYMHMSDEFVATIVGIIIFGAGLFSALASISISKVTRCVTMPRMVFTATWAVGTLFILQYMMPSIWGLGIFRAIAGFFMGFVTPIANRSYLRRFLLSGVALCLVLYRV